MCAIEVPMLGSFFRIHPQSNPVAYYRLQDHPLGLTSLCPSVQSNKSYLFYPYLGGFVIGDFLRFGRVWTGVAILRSTPATPPRVSYFLGSRSDAQYRTWVWVIWVYLCSLSVSHSVHCFLAGSYSPERIRGYSEQEYEQVRCSLKLDSLGNLAESACCFSRDMDACPGA